MVQMENNLISFLLILIILSIPFSYTSFLLLKSYNKKKRSLSKEDGIDQMHSYNSDLLPSKELIYKCQNCGTLVISTATKCPICGNPLNH